MSDIFISYAKEDLTLAQHFAKALAGQGWSVFWDQTIPAGSTWRDTIGRELDQARCVVVLWSPHSINSRWICDEELPDARDRQVLVPVLIAKVRLPPGFRGIQAADLSHWDRTETSSAFHGLVRDIALKIGPSPKQVAEELGAVDGMASIFPLMEFKADDDNVLRVHRFNSICCEFYGYAEDADLSNKTMQGLLENLQPYIDPPHPSWDDFQKDQRRVIDQLNRGYLPLAQVPIQFNEQHAHFARRIFVPLYLEKILSHGSEITRVLYLDVAKLPKGVFSAPIWSDLSVNIDLNKLSIELKQIADDWIREVPEVARARVQALTEAAAEVGEGGSMKVVTLLGEAGFFALRHFAQRGDYPNVQALLRRLLTQI